MTRLCRSRPRRSFLPLALVLSGSVACGADQAPEPASAAVQRRPAERFEAYFAAPRTEVAAISPDGRLLAYSLREDEVLSVVVIEIDRPEKALAKVAVVSDRQATPALSATSGERVPGRIPWMRWVSPTRLVVETNRVYATRASGSMTSGWVSVPGEVIAFDADGGRARVLADARRVTRMQPGYESLQDSAWVNPGAFVETGARDPETSGAPDAGAPASRGRLRAPRVLGLDPARAGSVLVLAASAAGCDLYSIHATTGNLVHVRHEAADPRMVGLLDRAGRTRIGIEYRTSKRLPLPFLLETPKFGRPWTRLDPIAVEAGFAPGFEIGPGNYFGHRHVPLGFDRSGDVLYFASNVGRDTFGIYGIDLAQKRKGAAAIESPGIDLWAPEPGVFPDPAPSWYSVGLDVEGLAGAMTAARRVALEEAGADSETIEALAEVTPPDAGPAEARVDISITPRRHTDDNPLIFDPHSGELAGLRIRGARTTTQWLRPDLAEAQAALEARFRPNSVEIRDWDREANRLVVLVSGPALPGAWFVHDRRAGSAAEFAQRTPGLAELASPSVYAFSFTSENQVAIRGLITVPRAPRVRPVPVVFVAPRLPWQRHEPRFQAEVHALADMGFAVVEYVGRGAWGTGAAVRARIHEGYEDAQVEDLLATATYVAEHFAVAADRSAVVGFDHGGHVALRALELAPQRFRCAVAVGAPVNLRAWLGELEWMGGSAYVLLVEPMFGDRARRARAPLVADIDRIERPALLFNYRGPAAGASTHSYLAARQFASALRRRVPTTEIVDLSQDFMRGLPQARAGVFARIEAFLNANIYDFAVKAGELEVDEPR